MPMRKLIYSMGVSLDGFIAGRGGDIDWSAPDEELHRFHNEQMRAVGAHLCGRGLYEAMVYWETADADPALPETGLEFARIWQALPKIVVSTTLESVVGNARLVRDGVAEEVANLKEQPGNDRRSAAPASPRPCWASSTSSGSLSVRSCSAAARRTSRPGTGRSTSNWWRHERSAPAWPISATRGTPDRALGRCPR
jgi:dihydrofolate reductase